MGIYLTYEFVKKSIDSDEYELISDTYEGQRKNLTILHKKCGREFLMNWDHWHRGQRCPHCNRYAQRKTDEQFLKDLEEKQPGRYTVLSDYINKRTNVKVMCNKCSYIFDALPDNLYRGICKKCSAIERSNRLRKNIEDVAIPDEYEIIGSYINNKTPIDIKHKKCGKVFTASTTNLRGGQHCPFCYATSSEGEDELLKFIQTIDPNSKKEKIYSDKNKHSFKEIDVYSEKNKIGIEYNGLYWHSDKKCNPNDLRDKMEYLNQRDIRVINIFEDEWKNKNEIVKDKLEAIFGIVKKKIYARKCEIKEVNSKDRNNFLKENHIQGADTANISLGLYNENNLVAVMSFCKLRKNLGNTKKEGVYELSRFAGLLGYNIVGGFSKLLAYAKNNYDIREIMTYADLRWTSKDHNVYINNGFKLDHVSKPSYDYVNLNKSNAIRENRFIYRKNNLKNKFPQIYSEELTEYDIMKKAGYTRIYNCGNLVYKLTL